jgi:D-arabinan exo alpha-(1,3)/(1,5)-arabinofuranosidase (non-reducing end)
MECTLPFSWSDITSADSQVVSRSINAENRTGRKGAAAQAASPLGAARKGSPSVRLEAGGTVVLADIEGPGMVRHIWMTLAETTDASPYVLRDVVLCAYWDDEQEPSIEVPVGDFFCNGFGKRTPVTSVPIVVAPNGGMNSYFRMPFRRRALLTLKSEHPVDLDQVYFQVDYTLNDQLGDDTAYLHAQWRRTNGTGKPGSDHLILDGVRGRGLYVGTYVGVTALERFWWGEGEVKFFLDGDGEFPTICSTGLEDYVGGAWAFQDGLRSDPPPNPQCFSAPYCGYPYFSARDVSRASEFATMMAPSHGLYRWHLPDPIYFAEGIRVTLQQIGAWQGGLFERSDDICSTAYWYQSSGSVDRMPLVPVHLRRPR